MADLSITASGVRPSANANIQTGRAGSAITAGEAIARDTDGTLKPADSNGTPPLNAIVGVACNSAPGVGQPISYVTNDVLFAPGCTPVSGTVYVLSVNPGGICPASDLSTSGEYTNIVGIGASSSVLVVNVFASGQAVP